MTTQEMIIASVASNIVALLLLLLSLHKKNLARFFFAILFIGAAWTNWNMAHNHPADYLEYGKYAIGFYKKIIYGEFSKHITGFVSMIAIAQLIIGLALLARGIVVKLSCFAGIIFLLCIAPLGFGSAFLFSIIAAIDLFILSKHDFQKNIFSNKWFV